MKGIQVYGYEMARISDVCFSTLSALMKPHGLERYFKLLLFVNENSGTYNQGEIAEIAESLLKDKVSILRSLDYLSERDLVERKQDKDNRRCQLIAITNKGRELIPLIKESIVETNNQLIKDIDENEIQVFSQVMDKLMLRIQTLPAPNYVVKPHKIK